MADFQINPNPMQRLSVAWAALHSLPPVELTQLYNAAIEYWSLFTDEEKRLYLLIRRRLLAFRESAALGFIPTNPIPDSDEFTFDYDAWLKKQQQGQGQSKNDNTVIDDNLSDDKDAGKQSQPKQATGRVHLVVGLSSSGSWGSSTAEYTFLEKNLPRKSAKVEVRVTIPTAPGAKAAWEKVEAEVKGKLPAFIWQQTDYFNHTANTHDLAKFRQNQNKIEAKLTELYRRHGGTGKIGLDITIQRGWFDWIANQWGLYTDSFLETAQQRYQEAKNLYNRATSWTPYLIVGGVILGAAYLFRPRVHLVKSI